jgi:hypothetical protein
MSDNLSLYDGKLTGLLPDKPYGRQCDAYALSLKFDYRRAHLTHFLDGKFALATKDKNGRWINAVEANTGGTKALKARKWKDGDPLGTYGIDPATKTVWAVVNYDGDFAATYLY